MANDSSSHVWVAPAGAVALLTLVWGVFFGLPKAADKPAPPAAAAAAPADNPPVAASPDDGGGPLSVLDALANFGDGHPPQTPRGLDKNTNCEFLIATLPDPIDSKFAYEFDAVVESIQRAYEARGFVLQSTWLPWPRQPAAGKAPADPAKAAAKYRTTPGTLLFRHVRSTTDPEKRYALVALVGENPISGVHKPALRAAVGLYDTLAKSEALRRPPLAAADPAEPCVRIVGPYYSGTQQGLAETLAAVNAEPVGKDEKDGKPLKERPLFFNLISGSATSLTPTLDYGDKKVNGAVHATANPSGDLIEAALSYLEGRRADPLVENPKREWARVAILKESNTGFGRSVGKPGATGPYLNLPFPISISRLQASLDKLDAGAAPPLPSLDPLVPQLPAREDAGLDGVAPFDPAAAPAVAWQWLSGALAAIDQEKVKYVGIVATDARDVVFLNKLVRRHCPNVRVFATEPSLAFLSAADSYHLRGMVTASSYPLYLPAQRWVGARDNVRLNFPVQSCQGIYNAVLAQCGEDDKMLGYRPVFGGGGDLRPPVWVGIVGEAGTLLPVHAYVSRGDAAGIVYRAAKPVPEAHDPPRVDVPVMIVVAHAVALIALIALIAVLAAVVLSWNARTDGSFWEKRFGDGGGAGGFWYAVLTAGALLFLLPYAFAAREAIFPHDPTCHGDGAAGNILVGLSTVVYAGIWLLAGLLALRGLRDRAFLLSAAVIAVAHGFLTAWWGFGLTPAERFFVYVRSIDVAAGLAPAVPLHFLGLAALCLGWYTLRQELLARKGWLGCPFPEEWQTVTAAHAAMERQFGRLFAVRRLGRGDVAVALAVGVVVVVTFVVRAKKLPSGEVAHWDGIMWGITLAVSVGLVASLVRFVNLWRAVETYVDLLQQLPIATALDRLPPAVRRTLDFYLLRGRPHVSELRVPIRMLSPADRADLKTLIADWWPQWAGLVGDPAHPADGGDPAPAPARRNLLNWLTERSRAFARELAPLWEARSVEDAFGKAPEEKKPADPKGKPPADDGAKDKATGDDGGKPPDDPHKKELEAKEQYVLAAAVFAVGAYFAQLRMLLYGIVLAAPALLLSGASYPFQPEQPSLLLLAALTAAVAAGVLVVLVRINRNSLLSRVNGTTPDKFTPDLGFLTSALVYVGPLVGVLAAHFLGLFRSLLDPLFGLFR